MTPSSRSTLRLSSPADLLACVPYLLGFHPADSVVLVAVHSGRVEFAARGDLPEPSSAAAAVNHLFDVLSRQRCDQLAVIGYGSAERVEPVIRAVEAAAARRALPILDLLRVTGGRWFSYTCVDPRCCPADGTVLDVAASPVAAEFAYAGAAALPDRSALERTVAPIGGLTRISMTQATGRAEASLAAWFEAVPAPERAGAVRAEGTTAVQAAISRYGEGGRLDDDEVARLAVLLTAIPVRDVAWEAITAEEPHLQLWMDVVQRAEPRLVPAPASLLGFTAWRVGNGALAALALERALREDPAYELANLLLHGLRHGLPPAVFAK